MTKIVNHDNIFHIPNFGANPYLVILPSRCKDKVI